MKTHVVLFLISFALYSGLRAQTTNEINENWRKAYNASEDFKGYYLEQAGLFTESTLYQNAEFSIKWLEIRESAGEIKRISGVEEFQLRTTQKYETGTYEAENMALRYVIGWRMIDGHWKKELEIISPEIEHKGSDFDRVAVSRQAWEDYANDHQPDQLVDNVCTPNGYYFNRGQVFRGKEIVEAYSYMNGPNWKIQLESNFVTQPDSNTILDIGTFTSGGSGLYVLVWVKQNSDWRLRLDFNF